MPSVVSSGIALLDKLCHEFVAFFGVESLLDLVGDRERIFVVSTEALSALSKLGTIPSSEIPAYFDALFDGSELLGSEISLLCYQKQLEQFTDSPKAAIEYIQQITRQNESIGLDLNTSYFKNILNSTKNHLPTSQELLQLVCYRFCEYAFGKAELAVLFSVGNEASAILELFLLAKEKFVAQAVESCKTLNPQLLERFLIGFRHFCASFEAKDERLAQFIRRFDVFMAVNKRDHPKALKIIRDFKKLELIPLLLGVESSKAESLIEEFRQLAPSFISALGLGLNVEVSQLERLYTQRLEEDALFCKLHQQIFKDEESAQLISNVSLPELISSTSLVAHPSAGSLISLGSIGDSSIEESAIDMISDLLNVNREDAVSMLRDHNNQLHNLLNTIYF